MSKEPIIMPDEAGLVQKVAIVPAEGIPNVVEILGNGWLGRSGRLYGRGSSEDLARWSESTHARCPCGGVARKLYTACDECRARKKAADYSALPSRPWTGEPLVYSNVTDEYYSSLDDILDDYANDNDLSEVEWQQLDAAMVMRKLQVVHCNPIWPKTINAEDVCGDMPDDGVIPPRVKELVEAFNRGIERYNAGWDDKSGEETVHRLNPPLGWEPAKVVATVGEGEKQ